MMKFLTLLFLLMSSLAFGQFSNQQKQFLVMDNLLSNPGLENGKSGWTCASGTFTADAAGKIDGGLSGKVVLTAQTLNCEIKVATNAALANAGAVILQSIKSSVAGVKVCPIIDNVEDVNACQSYDGSDIALELAMLPFFGSTNIGIKIKTDSAVTGTVFFDGSKVGRRSAAMMPGVAQTELHYITFGGASTQTTNGLLNGHAVGVIYGDSILAPTVSTNPSLRFKAGTYGEMTCYFAGRCRAGNGSGSTCTISYSGLNMSMTYGTAGSSGTTNADFSKTIIPAGVYPEREFQVQFTNVTPAASPSHSISNVTCLETPPASAVLANYLPWKVDVNIGGANPSLGVANVASYTSVESAALDLVQNAGSASVRIPCSGTNAATGATCSVGNEQIGVNIPSLPFPGEYRVCASFNHYAFATNPAALSTTFQLVQTANSAQTILQEGKAKSQSGGATGSLATNITTSQRNCGLFIFSDTSEKTIRLMYEQTVSGTPSGSFVSADRSASSGQPDVNITVEPVTPFMVASLKNMMTSPNYLRGLKTCIFAAGGAGSLAGPTSCTGSPCTTYLDSCGALTSTFTRSVAGDYSAPSTGWTPGGVVSCNASATGGSDAYSVMAFVADGSGNITIRTRVGTTTLVDAAFMLDCHGERP